MRRRQNFQTIGWFWDLFQRDLLDLEPPYQRRSVWNQSYKDYFIDTILLGYPAPAIFLYEEIDPDGKTAYHVVDGKQRLSTIFAFAKGEYPVADMAEREELRGSFFEELSPEDRRAFWGYPFSVEYVPTDDNTIINNIFDRINRNTAKLSAQELRHAKYSGEFISAAEELADSLVEELGDGFPNISKSSKRQMKDVEFVAHLLLLLEVGPRGYRTAELDAAFNDRDEHWEARVQVKRRFRRSVNVIGDTLEAPRRDEIRRSRLRNQADFYSLFGAIDRLLQEKVDADPHVWSSKLADFVKDVEDETRRLAEDGLRKYYEGARSASTNTSQRQTRVNIVRRLLLGQPLTAEQ